MVQTQVPEIPGEHVLLSHEAWSLVRLHKRVVWIYLLQCEIVRQRWLLNQNRIFILYTLNLCDVLYGEFFWKRWSELRKLYAAASKRMRNLPWSFILGNSLKHAYFWCSGLTPLRRPISLQSRSTTIWWGICLRAASRFLIFSLASSTGDRLTQSIEFEYNPKGF